MKRFKIFSAIFGAVGLALAILTVILSLNVLNAKPVLVSVPQDAVHTADALVAALSAGEFREAEKVLYGQPDLGMDREAADDVGQLIWDAFVESISCEFSGDFYVTDSGLARDMTLTALDFSSVTQPLKERSQLLLEKRVQSAENMSDVYDENNNYREDVVMDILYEAATRSLAEDAKVITRDVTLNLVYYRDQWWVKPDQSLIAAISGGTAG